MGSKFLFKVELYENGCETNSEGVIAAKSVLIPLGLFPFNKRYKTLPLLLELQYVLRQRTSNISESLINHMDVINHRRIPFDIITATINDLELHHVLRNSFCSIFHMKIVNKLTLKPSCWITQCTGEKRNGTFFIH